MVPVYKVTFLNRQRAAATATWQSQAPDAATAAAAAGAYILTGTTPAVDTPSMYDFVTAVLVP